MAFDHDADIRAMLRNDIPVFNRLCRDVAGEFLALQLARAKRGALSTTRGATIKSVISNVFEDYIGSTQIHHRQQWSLYARQRSSCLPVYQPLQER
jgi:hypothetical protein